MNFIIPNGFHIFSNCRWRCSIIENDSLQTFLFIFPIFYLTAAAVCFVFSYSLEVVKKMKRWAQKFNFLFSTLGKLKISPFLFYIIIKINTVVILRHSKYEMIDRKTESKKKQLVRESYDEKIGHIIKIHTLCKYSCN